MFSHLDNWYIKSCPKGVPEKLEGILHSDMRYILDAFVISNTIRPMLHHFIGINDSCILRLFNENQHIDIFVNTTCFTWLHRLSNTMWKWTLDTALSPLSSNSGYCPSCLLRIV